TAGLAAASVTRRSPGPSSRPWSRARAWPRASCGRDVGLRRKARLGRELNQEHLRAVWSSGQLRRGFAGHAVDARVQTVGTVALHQAPGNNDEEAILQR